MASSELSTILDRGWEALPVIRQALSVITTNQFDSDFAADLGNRLLRLATDFERSGHPLPARQTLSLSEAFSELGWQSPVPTSELAEALRTVVSQWEDLLVELDAVGRIAGILPIDSTMSLDSMTARRRLSRCAAESTSKILSDVTPESLSALQHCGDSLLDASSSLLARVRRDDASPYAAPVSRIHHLAGALWERLRDFTSSFHSAHGSSSELTATSEENESEPMATEPQTAQFHVYAEATTSESDECDHDEIGIDPAAKSICRPPKVLVIDESPFFRMLLKSAIESVRHAASTLSSLDEAEALLNESEASDIVIWGGIESLAQTDCLTEWRQRRDQSRRPTLIGLTNCNNDSGESPAEFDHIVQRSQVVELLKIVRDKFGDESQAIKRIA